MRFVLYCSLLGLLLAACQEKPATATKAATKAATKTATKAATKDKDKNKGKKPATATATATAERDGAEPTVSGDKKADGPCDRMLATLEKCNKGSPAFRDQRFRRNFLTGCGREIKRPTEYAKHFLKCAEMADCDGLKTCSQILERKSVELGPEHVDYLLTNNQRDDALKFCEDHRRAMNGNLAMERRCHPLLKVLDTQRKELEHKCPLDHDHSQDDH
jgi:hypothetical protein